MCFFKTRASHKDSSGPYKCNRCHKCNNLNKFVILKGQKLVIKFYKKFIEKFVQGAEIICKCCLAIMPVSERCGLWSFESNQNKLFGKIIEAKPVNEEWSAEYVEKLNKDLVNSEIVHKKSVKLNQE